MTAAMNAAPGKSGNAALGFLPAPHEQILRALRRPLRSARFLLLFLLFPALALWASLDAAWVTLLVSGCIALQFLWWLVFGGLMAQNQPHAARLVPGQLRCLRETTVALFLFLAVTASLPLGARIGHAPAWLILIAACQFGFAVCCRWPLLWVFIWIVPSMAGWWLKSAFWIALRDAALTVYALHPWSLALLALALMSAALYRLLPSGGSVPMQPLQALFTGATKRAPAGPAHRLTDRLARLFNWPRAPWLAHLLSRAEPTARSSLARADLALLRSTHWTSQLAAISFFAGLMLLISLFIGWPRMLAQAEFWQGAAPGVSIGVMSMCINPLLGSAGLLYKTRREQALLMLLPGMPRGAELNRAMARRQMLHFLLMWSMGTSVMLLIHLLAVDNSIGLAYAAITLPLASLQWRDWSRQGPPRASGFIKLALLVAPALGLSIWGLSRGVLSLGPLFAAAGAVALLLAVARWPALQRFPQAFPTGRNYKA